MRKNSILRQMILPVLFAALLLTIGCTVVREVESTETDEEYVVLHVLTESSTVDGMKSQIMELMSVFEAEHKHVNLILDTLPAEGLARQKAISQVFVDIANGEGPDIYLMPCGSTVSVSTGSYLTGTAEPLFANVTEHMYKGTFADISACYDADSTLDKDALVSGVMEAGVVDDARYALPLRYSIPVVYADRAALADTVLTEEILNMGIEDILQAVISVRDTTLALGVDPVSIHNRYLFNFFTDLADYENCKVTLRDGELNKFLYRAYTVHAWTRDEEAPTAPHVGSYISMGDYFTEKGIPLTISKLESALDVAAIAKSLGIELTMVPLRGVEGDLVADVTYFGAVGADCEHPELAYEFLRMLLSKDAQWELSRPRSTKGFQSGLIAAGWPVRAEGAAEYLWQNLKFQLGFYVGQGEGWQVRMDALKQVDLTDADISGLITAVDAARFNHPVEGEATFDYIDYRDIEFYAWSDAYETVYAMNAHMNNFREDMQ